MKKPLLALLAVALVIAFVLAFAYWRQQDQGDAPLGATGIKNQAQAGHVVVAFGDGLSGAEGYAPALAALLGQEIQVLGRDGDSTSAALIRVDAVLERRPNFVIVTLGAEDLRQRLPLDETLSALETIFNRLLASGALVAFVSIDVPGIGDNWAMAVEGLAESRGVLVVPDGTSDVWSTPDALDASTELDEPARQTIATRVQAALQPYWQKSGTPD